MIDVGGSVVEGRTQAVREAMPKRGGSLLRDASGVPLAEVRGVQVVAVARYALDFNGAVAFDAKSSASHGWVSRFCGEWSLAFALMAFVVALAFANATLGCDRIETYLLFSALSAAIGKQLLASCSEHSTDMPIAIGSKVSRRWPLYVLALTALFTVTFALECDIDLSQISSNETYPGFAQCDAGCDSCNFSLDTGTFQFGTVNCLATVPCFIQVTSYVKWALAYSTVNGLQASALSVHTSNTNWSPWNHAVFHAPANRGNFRFEAHNVTAAVYDTTFHAVNTGVVDIVIDKVSYPLYAEMQGMDVYASTADELNIVIGEDTRYGRNYDSSIECPATGQCTWQSFGQRYIGDLMKDVNLIAFPGTEMRVICEDNADSCDDVFVHCHDTGDSCEMQYDGDWQCDGTLNFGNYTFTGDAWQCPLKPSTTTPETTDLPESESQSNGFLVYGLVIGALAVCCLAAAFCCYYHYYRRQHSAESTAPRDSISPEGVDSAKLPLAGYMSDSRKESGDLWKGAQLPVAESTIGAPTAAQRRRAYTIEELAQRSEERIDDLVGGQRLADDGGDIQATVGGFVATEMAEESLTDYSADEKTEHCDEGVEGFEDASDSQPAFGVLAAADAASEWLAPVSGVGDEKRDVESAGELVSCQPLVEGFEDEADEKELAPKNDADVEY